MLKEVTYYSFRLFRSLFVEAQVAAGWVHVLFATQLTYFVLCDLIKSQEC